MSLISVSQLTFGYEGSYDMIFEDASFLLDTDWKLGLIGRNGRGKTTLLKLLMGEYSYSGKIVTDAVLIIFPFRRRIYRPRAGCGRNGMPGLRILAAGAGTVTAAGRRGSIASSLWNAQPRGTDKGPFSGFVSQRKPFSSH